jgi:hypothetical protein
VSPACIYVLSDPTTDTIRYVGKTMKRPQQRLSEHLSEARAGRRRHVYNWIRSLTAPPRIEVIEDGLAPEQAADAERFWISQFSAWGFKLTNATEGGEGVVGHRHSLETKQKMAAAKKGRPGTNLGKKFGPSSEEANHKRRVALKDRVLGPYSEERREAIRRGCQQRDARRRMLNCST